ncbi:MAG: transposase [Gammaproteobacteria bacterium]
MEMGVDFVFPKHAGRQCDFRKGVRLSQGDHLITWKRPARPEWMSEDEYQKCPEIIQLRETKIILNKSGFRSESMVMITSFLDSKLVDSKALQELYSLRWSVELDLRSLKTVMKMDILRCKTPEMVRKEIWAHILAYNLVRKIMAQSVLMHKIMPCKMSFKLALQVISSFRQMPLR